MPGSERGLRDPKEASREAGLWGQHTALGAERRADLYKACTPPAVSEPHPSPTLGGAKTLLSNVKPRI